MLAGLTMSYLYSPPSGLAKDSISSDKQWQLIDSFENVNEWTPLNGEGTTISTKSCEGKKGKAIEINYNLGTTKQWVIIQYLVSLEVPKTGAFRLWVKGSGAKNNLEFKLVDIDGSNFIRLYPAVSGITVRNGWTLITIPIKSLVYGWGGNEQLDKLQEISIGVTAANGEKGVLCVDELEYSPQ